MATHASARKRARQAEKRRIRNRQVRGRVKSIVKAVNGALESGSDDARELVRRAESVIRQARRAQKLVAAK